MASRLLETFEDIVTENELMNEMLERCLYESPEDDTDDDDHDSDAKKPLLPSNDRGAGAATQGVELKPLLKE